MTWATMSSVVMMSPTPQIAVSADLIAPRSLLPTPCGCSMLDSLRSAGLCPRSSCPGARRRRAGHAVSLPPGGPGGREPSGGRAAYFFTPAILSSSAMTFSVMFWPGYFLSSQGVASSFQTAGMLAFFRKTSRSASVGV